MTMQLPEQVQKQADYADALEQSMQKAPVTEAAEPKQQDNEPEDVVGKLKQKYASLQGKYNAEVPRLHARTKELEDRNQQLLNEMQSLRGEIANQTSKQVYLTDEDKETYGEDWIELIRRGAKEESAQFAAKAAELQSKVDQLESQMSWAAQETAAMRNENFFSALASDCPTWQEQNTDKGFNDWLDVTATYGVTRREALNRAFNMLDARSCAAIFNEYRAKANPLSRQVEPETNRAQAGVANPGSQRIWTQDDIQRFYDSYRRREIPDEQALAIEKEIEEAVASGRVR